MVETFKNHVELSMKCSGILLSTDGSKIISINSDGTLYRSNNYGESWTKNNCISGIFRCASSSDFSKLVAADRKYIYTSTYSGVSWTQRTSAGSRDWCAITSPNIYII